LQVIFVNPLTLTHEAHLAPEAPKLPASSFPGAFWAFSECRKHPLKMKKNMAKSGAAARHQKPQATEEKTDKVF